jgi:hypothetical protein
MEGREVPLLLVQWILILRIKVVQWAILIRREILVQWEVLV